MYISKTFYHLITLYYFSQFLLKENTSVLACAVAGRYSYHPPADCSPSCLHSLNFPRDKDNSNLAHFWLAWYLIQLVFKGPTNMPMKQWCSLTYNIKESVLKNPRIGEFVIIVLEQAWRDSVAQFCNIWREFLWWRDFGGHFAWIALKIESSRQPWRHFPSQPFCPVLVLAFAWQLFSSLHLRLAPFLGSLIVLLFHNWSSEFWKSTVLDSAKPFGQICFFCYIALSILSLGVHLKERVVA